VTLVEKPNMIGGSNSIRQKNRRATLPPDRFFSLNRHPVRQPRRLRQVVYKLALRVSTKLNGVDDLATSVSRAHHIKDVNSNKSLEFELP
jgi:hypothetical protein